MKTSPTWHGALLALLLTPALGSCDSALQEILEGRTCDAEGRCLDGYTCDTATNTCVKSGQTSTGGSTSTSSTGGSTTSTGGTTSSSGGGGGSTTSSSAGGGTGGSGGITGSGGIAGSGGSGGVTASGGSGGSGGMTGTGGSGGITGPTCDPGQELCDAMCVQVTSDPQHCGDCATACGPGTTCVASACAAVCPPGLTLCSGQCVNLQTDPDHCGACSGIGGLGGTGTCGLVAPVCQSAKCKGSCDNGMTVCSNACTDLAKDPAHCGNCATACTTGQLCVSSACKGFIYATAAWECTATYPTFCTYKGKTLCTSAAACPQ